MANITVTNTFANSTTADATQVNQNFTDIINGTSDGTKDFSISALTVAGAATLNGNVTLGNASGDDITVTGSLAGSIPIKTTFNSDIGAATLGLKSIYLGSDDSAAFSVRVIAGTMGASYTLTLPTAVPTQSHFMLKASTSGVGSFSDPNVVQVVAKTATYTATLADDVITVDTSGGAWTLDLPTAVGNGGKVYTIKKIEASTNALTIDPDGTETIEGDTTRKMFTLNETYKIVSNNANWVALDHKTNTSWVAYTPTGTWSTNTTYTGKWRRVGDSVHCMVQLSMAGNASGGSLVVDIPNATAWTIDTAKLLGTTGNRTLIPGSCQAFDSTVSNFGHCSIMYESTTRVRPQGESGTSGGGTTQNVVNDSVPFTFASGDLISLHFTVPITDWDE